jgi:hypothetical protein
MLHNPRNDKKGMHSAPPPELSILGTPAPYAASEFIVGGEYLEI